MFPLTDFNNWFDGHPRWSESQIGGDCVRKGKRVCRKGEIERKMEDKKAAKAKQKKQIQT